MDLSHCGLIIQLDVGAGEGRGACNLTVTRLHHPDGGHPLTPGVPEVLPVDIATELEDHWIVRGGDGSARRLDHT